MSCLQVLCVWQSFLFVTYIPFLFATYIPLFCCDFVCSYFFFFFFFFFFLCTLVLYSCPFFILFFLIFLISQALSRQHVVTASPSGLVTVMGGKYTTYRQMAQDTVDEALKHVDKDSLSLAGTTSAKLANVSITFNMGLHGTDSTGKICGMNYKLLENFIRSRRPHLEDGVVKHLVKKYVCQRMLSQKQKHCS